MPLRLPCAPARIYWGLAALIELTQWVIDATEPLAAPFDALWDSLVLSVLGTALTLILAFGAEWATANGSRKDQRWLPQAVYLSSALPGVLLAFGLLMVALRLSKGIDGAYAMVLGSGLLLFLGYAMFSCGGLWTDLSGFSR